MQIVGVFACAQDPMMGARQVDILIYNSQVESYLIVFCMDVYVWLHGIWSDSNGQEGTGWTRVHINHVRPPNVIDKKVWRRLLRRRLGLRASQYMHARQLPWNSIHRMGNAIKDHLCNLLTRQSVRCNQPAGILSNKTWVRQRNQVRGFAPRRLFGAKVFLIQEALGPLRGHERQRGRRARSCGHREWQRGRIRRHHRSNCRFPAQAAARSSRRQCCCRFHCEPLLPQATGVSQNASFITSARQRSACYLSSFSDNSPTIAPQ